MTLAQRLLTAALPALTVLLLVAGCGSSGPELGTVSGTVTLGGKPLDKAVVVFQPEEKGRSPSTAMTDEKGFYELMFPGERRGALPGKHKVTVSTYRQESLPNGKTREIPESVPAQYTSTSTTPLVKDVTAGSNTIDLAL